MESALVSCLEKMKHAFEQIRRQGNDDVVEKQIEVYLGAVHWVDELFHVPEDKNLQIDVAYRNFLSSYHLSLDEESQQLLLFSDETNAEAFAALSAVKNVLLGFENELKTISLHGRSLNQLFCKDFSVNVREVHENMLPFDNPERAILGNGAVIRKFETTVIPREGTPSDRVFVNWCSLLFWLSKRHDTDIRATSQFIVSDDLARSKGEVIFQEWYKLGAPATWVAAATISRFEEGDCPLKEWTEKCDVNSVGKPVAISCSLKNDLIDASVAAVDYLIARARHTKESVQQERRRDKNAGEEHLACFVDTLLKFHESPECRIPRGQKEFVDEMNKRTKAQKKKWNQSQICKLLKEFIDKANSLKDLKKMFGIAPARTLNGKYQFMLWYKERAVDGSIHSIAIAVAQKYFLPILISIAKKMPRDNTEASLLTNQWEDRNNEP